MIIWDMEVFKHDWVLVYLDTNKRQLFEIVNSKEELQKLYDDNKYEIWVGYNSRGYDQWILKAILCDFNPYEVSDWIINKERKGFEFSTMLNKFPILNYDAMVFGRSLKQLEAFMGHDIRETSVPFDIDRKLTDSEIKDTLKYCAHDVNELFHVFIETAADFETQMEIIKDYKLSITAVGKTQTQLTAMVLGAKKREYDDEFDITISDKIELGKYEFLREKYKEWARDIRDYDYTIQAIIAGVEHELGFGGLHGAVKGHIGDGLYLMADGFSYYPSLMIIYDFFSRSIPEWGKKRFKEMYKHRWELKQANNKVGQAPYKLVLNKTYGGLKDRFNDLYDPVQANNICINGQLLLIDLIDKVEHIVDVIQSNTDGVLLKLRREEDFEELMEICRKWTERTGIILEFDRFNKVIQKDVNNYIMVAGNGDVKRKGLYVKKLSPLDNHLPIVNKAIVDYFTKGIPVEVTISNATDLIDFQFITKVSNKYSNAVYNNKELDDKVYRVFATKVGGHTLYKCHKAKGTLEKTTGTPDSCIIINDDIQGKKVFQSIDKDWYIDLAKKRIDEFTKRG